MYCMLFITPNTTIKNVYGNVLLNLSVKSFLCILILYTITCTLSLFIFLRLSHCCLQALYPYESPFLCMQVPLKW